MSDQDRAHGGRHHLRGRLIVVSNRVADPDHVAKAGGLAVAVKESLKEEGGLWFGWSGEIRDDGDLPPPGSVTQDGIAYVTTDLTRQEYDTYYLGYANQVLWPILHQRLDLACFDDGFREGYFSVNLRFAREIQKRAAPQDVIWIQDYHLLPLAHQLRDLGCAQRIGLFLHTPLPHRQFLVTLPGHRTLMRCLLQCDVLGFQTRQDASNFIGYALDELGAVRVKDDVLQAGERRITVGAFPIGIDLDELRRFVSGPSAERDITRSRDGLAGRQQIIGADRLDYSKGLPERFKAMHRLLSDHPELRDRIVLFQVASPSRSSLTSYRSLRWTLDQLAGSINGEFGHGGWQPLVYIRRNMARSTLVRRFRISRVGLVTPLRDGMNLVAKEYVAAQDQADPGVLVLSEFAGAAEQMTAALLVNPHDIPATAAALRRALGMSRQERQERHADLVRLVEATAIHRWRTAFMKALQQAPFDQRALVES